MKTLLTLSLVVLMAATASAQLTNSMGVFFVADDFSEAATNVDPAAGVPFDAYVCLIASDIISIGAYEVGMELDDATVFALAVTGPNGWTNFGDNYNHLAGFQTPLVSSTGNFVLSTMTMLYSGTATVNWFMGPSVPSSVDNAGPAVSDGANPDILYVCNYTSGPDDGGRVGTFNGEGIQFPGVATEAHSLSSVKALFN